MLKFIFAGVWVCVVTLGSAYGVMSWQAERQRSAVVAEKATEAVELQQLKTKMISVPIVDHGVVRGYVLAQFTFSVDARLLTTLPAKPDLFLVDEAFRVIYAGKAINFRTIRRPDVAALSRQIKENVNKRLGVNLVHTVFVQELNYLPKEQFRGGG